MRQADDNKSMSEQGVTELSRNSYLELSLLVFKPHTFFVNMENMKLIKTRNMDGSTFDLFQQTND